MLRNWDGFKQVTEEDEAHMVWKWFKLYKDLEIVSEKTGWSVEVMQRLLLKYYPKLRRAPKSLKKSLV